MTHSLTGARVAVAAAFFAQGFVFISLTTRLPRFLERWGLDEVTLSLLLLMMVLLAGVGSLVAEHASRRVGSAALLRLAFVLMVVAVPSVVLAPAVGVFVGGVAAYGVALGLVDATSNMQAVDLEHRYDRPILPSSHGWWTTGGITASIASLATGHLSPAVGAFVVVVPLLAAFAPYLPHLRADDAGRSRDGLYLSPDAGGAVPGLTRTGSTGAVMPGAGPGAGGPGAGPGAGGPGAGPRGTGRPDAAAGSGTAGSSAAGPSAAGPSAAGPGTAGPVPWRPIWLVGVGLVVFYMVDTAASAWGPVYLARAFDAPGNLVALATFPYLVTSIVVRLAGGALVTRFGVTVLLRVGAVVAFAALALVVLAPTWQAAVAGFTVLGAAIALVAPLSFSAAGRIAAGRIAAGRTAAAAGESVGGGTRATAGGGGDPIGTTGDRPTGATGATAGVGAAERARTDAVIARFNQFNYVGALLGAVLTGLVGADNLRLGFALPAVLVLALVPLAPAFARGSFSRP